VRQRRQPSEIGRLAAPLARALDAVWQRMHWWVATMAVLYLLSGITIVRPDEVAVILRWGKLVGATGALQEHGPGPLFALPPPIDEVVRVPVKHISEVKVETLTSFHAPKGDTLDPLTQGYALTGDQNILQVNMIARYRIVSAGEWAFYGPKADEVLKTEVTSAMIRTLGEMPVDTVLADGRKELVATATQRAQAGLSAAHSGLELTSLELVVLAPPGPSLAKEFNAVTSAYIGAETQKKDAQTYAEKAIPQAQAETDTALQTARATASADMARARGDADAFLALDKEFRANPAVVRERLYRDGVERAIGGAANVRWIPPPSGGQYHGLRVTVAPAESGATPAAVPSPSPKATSAPRGGP
jgi:modulator of FtsH protease HflK